MNLPQLHAERRRLLKEVRGAEMSKQYELAAHLLEKFQVVNQQVRDVEEYHHQDVRHELAMAAVGE